MARPEEAEWPTWSGHLQAAHATLRDDRFYGAMGGLGRIYFSALDRYATRHGIEGEAFHEFVLLMRALDDEYVAVQAEKMKEEAEKNKK